ncbi:MAG TPA: T9SS type A sorting domain-containing protein [Edaphocola sp.]|nr:T9SS type A sorting domain-containing protein [Edaphocola sp.]
MKQLFYSIFSLLLLSSSRAEAQTYIYSTITGSYSGSGTNSVTGTGSWSSSTVLPDFTYSSTTSNNRISQLSNTLGGASSEVDATNVWETKYGEIDANTTNCIKIRCINNASSTGSPLLEPITTVITFNQATSASTGDWGFLVSDIDVDQVTIKAKDASGNYYSTATINSWFKGVLNMSTSTSSSTPCYDNLNNTVVGADYSCVKQTTLSVGNDVNGPAAYFEPNQPVSTLEFVFDNLQPSTGTPSQRYFIAAKTTSPTPVKLINFSTKKENDNSLLLWATASEQNNKGFEIERSLDGRNWTRIGFVSSLAENCNSRTKLDYTYTDNIPSNGKNYYRLKQTDFDGRFEYSPVRMVSFNKESNISIYPNPANDHIIISGLEGNENIKVYNVSGRLIHQIKAENAIVAIALDNLSEGVYHINIINKEGNVSSHKVVKTK